MAALPWNQCNLRAEYADKRRQRFFRGFAVEQAVIARLVTRRLPIREDSGYLTMDRTH